MLKVCKGVNVKAKPALEWQYLLPLPHAALPEVLTQGTDLQEQQFLLSLPSADINLLLGDRLCAAQLHESALQVFKQEADATKGEAPLPTNEHMQSPCWPKHSAQHDAPQKHCTSAINF